MRVTILGSSPACPNPGGASSGYLLESREGRLLMDCGHAVVPFLETVTDFTSINAIILSHMHPDHFFDLIPLKYGLQFTGTGPLPLYIPPDGLDMLERVRQALHLHDTFWTEAYQLETYDPHTPLTVAGITIRFAPTKHFVPAYAMHLEEQGNRASLGYTSDTAWDEDVLDLLRGTSLALVEATLTNTAEGSVTDGHMTAAQAGRMARMAGVERLVLTHYWHTLEDVVLAEAGRAFQNQVEMACQGQVYEI